MVEGDPHLRNPLHLESPRWRITQGHRVGSASYRLTSLSFHIIPPIPDIRRFQNLTLKIQGQGHGWDQSSKSQSGFDFPSTHIPFVLCKSAIPFLGYCFFKIWSWESKVKVITQGHTVGPTSYQLTFVSFHDTIDSHPFRSVSINLPISDIELFSKFDLENTR